MRLGWIRRSRYRRSRLPRSRCRFLEWQCGSLRRRPHGLRRERRGGHLPCEGLRRRDFAHEFAARECPRRQEVTPISGMEAPMKRLIPVATVAALLALAAGSTAFATQHVAKAKSRAATHAVAAVA